MVGSADIKLNTVATRISSILLGPLQRLKAALLERVERGKSRRRHLELVESLSLGNRRELFLIVCDDHRFLVGAGADRIGTLVAMPESTSDAAVLPPAAPKPPRVDKQDRRSIWMRGQFSVASGTSGLQLVKREEGSHAGAGRQGSAEAGRTQW